MAAPPIVLNLPANHRLLVAMPAAVANPPTPANLKDATRFKYEVVQELVRNPDLADGVIEATVMFEADVLAARQVAAAGGPAALAAAAIPGAPVAAPIAFVGLGLVLNAINRLETKIDRMDRKLVIIANGQRGTGAGTPFEEVPFPDGTLPSVPILAPPAQARPALPPIRDVDDIRQLSSANAGLYLQYHGQAQGANHAARRRRRVATLVGCLAPL
ncbi:hypothetical protein DFH09DRAFT_541893 [Mycena vulgaris]|nr:hypothetical protein DFH09DRAFT_541893 [Mycena vulgaris]